MSEISGNSPGPSSGGEDRLPAAFRKRGSPSPGSDSTAAIPRRGGFEQVLGEELGSVNRMGSSSSAASNAPMENLLISRNLGALYRSFLNLEG